MKNKYEKALELKDNEFKILILKSRYSKFCCKSIEIEEKDIICECL